MKYEQIFKAFSEEIRLRIIILLYNRELCVCDIESTLNESQSKISRHLSYLKNSNIVIASRHGKWMHYRLNNSKSFFKSFFKLTYEELSKEKPYKTDITILKKRLENKECKCQIIKEA